MFLRRMVRIFNASTRGEWLVALGLFLVIAISSFLQMQATYAAVEVNNCILGADAATYFNALTDGHYLALRVHKHAAAVIAIALLAEPLTVLGVDPLFAGLLALSLIEGFAASMIFVLLRRQLRDTLAAAVLTVFVFASFGTVTLLGIAETYGVTLACIAAACLLFGVIAPLSRRWPLQAAIAAGFAGALPALANAPAAAFLLVYYALAMPYLRTGSLGDRMLRFFVPAILAVAISMLPALAAEGIQGSHWQSDYLDRYAEWSNFTDGPILANYAVSVLAFSWVGPLDWLQCRYLLSDLAALAAQPLRLAALVATLGVLGAGLYRALSGPMRPVSFAQLAAAGLLILFYLYFNPDEALLYSPQWILAIVLAASPGIAGSRAFVAAAAVSAGLMLAANIGPLHHPKSHDPDFCCPVPPSTMLWNEMPRDLVRQGKVIKH